MPRTEQSNLSHRGLRSLFRPVRKPVAKCLAWKPLRKLLTKNFQTGFIAFGEKNLYVVPPYWVTVDLEDADIPYDLRDRRPLPFADNSQAVIYTSHCLEHIDLESLQFFLREARRVLKPGGGMRIEVPNAERIYEAYRMRDDHFFQEIEGGPTDTPAHVTFVGLLSCYIEGGRHVPVRPTRERVDEKMNALSMEMFFDWCVSLQSEEQYRSGGHITPLYPANLRKMLSSAGFSSIFDCRPYESHLSGVNFKGIERPHRANYSLHMEAIK